MKLKVLLTFSLLFGAASPSFAQDSAPEIAVLAADAGPAISVPATAVTETPEASAVAPEKAEAPKEGVKQTALSKLSEELMDIFIPAFLALISSLVAFLLNWVRKKFKLNVSNDQIDIWAKVAEKAAARGAEWARNKAKDLTEGEKVPGPEVLEVAVDWAVEMGKTFKLPEMGREKLIGLIESHLHNKRTTLAAE